MMTWTISTDFFKTNISFVVFNIQISVKKINSLKLTGCDILVFIYFFRSNWLKYAFLFPGAANFTLTTKLCKYSNKFLNVKYTFILGLKTTYYWLRYVTECARRSAWKGAI